MAKSKKAGRQADKQKTAAQENDKLSKIDAGIDLPASLVKWILQFWAVPVALYMCYMHKWYLNQVHENHMYFTEIKEVEREISFRTESGLYYNAFKNVVRAPTFYDGVMGLIEDKTVEYPHTVNIVQRMNVYQEILLAGIWRCSSSVFISIFGDMAPIQFYHGAAHWIQFLQPFMVFCLAFCLTGKESVPSLLAVGGFICNLADTTRADHSAPLRECWAIPLLMLEMYLICRYIKHSKGLTVTAMACFAFAICWQFNQFVLLLQAVSLYGLYLFNLLPFQKIKKIYLCVLLGPLILVWILQFFNPMIPRAIMLSFILSVLLVHPATPKYSTKDGFIKKILVILANLCSVAVCVISLNYGIKLIFPAEADSHIFKFLQSKLIKASQCTDFDASLYTCNGAFGFMERQVYERLTMGGGFMIAYALVTVFFCGKFIYWALFNSVDENGKPTIDLGFDPAQSYLIMNAVAFYFLSALIVRLKYLWTPLVMVIAVIGWCKLFEGRSCWKSALVKYLACFASAGVAVWRQQPVWKHELDSLLEFHDPDTVEFLEWINGNVEPSAVFSSSMQVASMIRLSTDRAITNHPHYEDKVLRDTTFDIYQMYARISPADYKKRLAKHGTTHIVIENSICYQKDSVSEDEKLNDPGVVERAACATKLILDRANLHVDVNSGEYKKGLPPRFCDNLIRNGGAKEFKKIFENRTFLIYKVQ